VVKERGRRKRKKEEHGAGQGGDSQSEYFPVASGRVGRVQESAL